MTAASMEKEAARVAAVQALGLLDTEPDPEFDELVELAAAICGTPISLISLVDERRQWFKAAVGVEAKETPRDIAFCVHAIQQPDLFIVEDALEDERFAANPLVTGDPKIRFYAGFPLGTPDGSAVGTLCVIDRKPRQLTPQQQRALRVLARQVMAKMERRLLRQQLDAANAEKEVIAAGLHASEDIFRAFMNNTPMACCIRDANGNFVFRNTRYLDAFGDGDGGPSVLTSNALSVVRNEHVSEEEGGTRHWRSFVFPCRDAAGNELSACIAVDITHDIERNQEIARYQTELEAANKRFRNLSVTDELTGLYNRRAFEERLTFEFTMSRRKKRDLALLLLDADDFKKVNDQFGHPAGDTVLQQLARVIQRTVRTTDLAVRYGGEEFAILLTETDEEGGLLLCGRLQKALAEATWEHRPITLSMGVAALSPDVIDGAHLVELADRALYRAKREGKNRAFAATLSQAKRA